MSAVADQPTQTSLALCLITFQRPVGLRAALEGIGSLDVTDCSVDLKVVVVDNDSAESARVLVDEIAEGFPFPVTYAVEPRQGIPFARNRAVEAAGEVDFIGWMDDDEVPTPTWLASLLAMQRRTDADVVLGPSEPDLPPSAASWVADGGFFERTRFPTGTSIAANYARTSGVLVRRSAMPHRDAAFAEELRYTGGSDREHFVAMERSGARFVWVDEAIVVETVPPSRASAKWILSRAFRIGNSRSITLILQNPSPSRRAKRVAGGIAKTVSGGVSALVGVRRGRADVMRGIWQSCYGAGLASGAMGYRYQEYRRHHGG